AVAAEPHRHPLAGFVTRPRSDALVRRVARARESAPRRAQRGRERVRALRVGIGTDERVPTVDREGGEGEGDVDAVAGAELEPVGSWARGPVEAIAERAPTRGRV